MTGKMLIGGGDGIEKMVGKKTQRNTRRWPTSQKQVGTLALTGVAARISKSSFLREQSQKQGLAHGVNSCRLTVQG